MYSKGKIYKITDTANNECYYGSTIQPLSKRMGQHRIGYKAYKNGKYHKVSSFILFDKYGLENCFIVLVENYECKTKEELHQRERFYIENNECVNKVMPGRTAKQYFEANKEKIKEYYKEYREANKEQRKEYDKEYNEANKEKKKEYQKEYREDNKEKIKKMKKEWYEQNKEKIKNKDKEKILANMDNF
jgi:hypothetical protein